MGDVTLPSSQSDSAMASLLTALAHEACTGLFEAYGVDLKATDWNAMPRGPLTLSAIVGFGGEAIHGTCILAATESPIAESKQVDVPLRDWVAELGNQMVGRIRNRLLSHGVEVYQTSTVVIRSESMTPLPSRAFVPLAFESRSGQVFVWVDLEIEAGFRFGEPAQAMEEGEAIIF
jgi:CheY-specific phosphatase CheX